MISQSRTIFSLIIFLGCIQAALNPLRLLSIFNMAYINLIVIYAIGALSFLFWISKNKRMLGVEYILLGLVGINLIYSLSLGNDYFSLFTGLIRPLFFIVIIKVFSTIPFTESHKYIPLEKGVDWLTISYVIGVTITAYVYLFVGGIRASASAIPLALPFFYYFLNKKYYKAFLTIFLFFLGGKLGPLFGVVFALYFMFFFKAKRLLFSFIIIGLFFILFSSLIHYGYIDLWKVPALAKLNFHQLVEKGWELELFDQVMLGGRLSEVFSAINGLSSNNQIGNFLFGGGLGYNYLWESISGVPIRLENRGAHFTPIAVFVEYGIPFALILFLYLFKYLFKSIKILINYPQHSKVIVLWACFFIASFLNMLTAYSLFTNLLLAVSIGFLQYKKEK